MNLSHYDQMKFYHHLIYFHIATLMSFNMSLYFYYILRSLRAEALSCTSLIHLYLAQV